MKKRADNFSYDIILEPVVTEKSTNLSSLKKVLKNFLKLMLLKWILLIFTQDLKWLEEELQELLDTKKLLLL